MSRRGIAVTVPRQAAVVASDLRDHHELAGCTTSVVLVVIVVSVVIVLLVVVPPIKVRWRDTDRTPALCRPPVA